MYVYVLNDWLIDYILLLEEGYWKGLHFKDKKLILGWKKKEIDYKFFFELYSVRKIWRKIVYFKINKYKENFFFFFYCATNE